MKRIVPTLLLLSVGCNYQTEFDMNNELMAVDKAFFSPSKDKGINNAFSSYVEEECAMLRPNSMPVIGKSAIVKLFHNDDSQIELTWEPLYANVAPSGEIRYTFGTYEIIIDEALERSTYVSVWKKNNIS